MEKDVNNQIAKYLPFLILAIIIAMISSWFLTKKYPIERAKDDDMLQVSVEDEEKAMESLLVKGKGKAPDIASKPQFAGIWANFRGPDHDNIIKEDIKLATKWGASGPKKLWKKKVAKGYAGVSILNGRAYIHDYDEEKKRDVIRCLSLETGREIWNHSYPIKIQSSHGVTRAVPSVNEKYLVSIGPKAQLYCLDPITGEKKWSKSLVAEFETKVPTWYSAQSPILEGDEIILAPSGPEALILKLNAETGEIIWKTPNPLGWTMTHTSVVKMDLGDRQSYVYSASGGIVGVDAETGEVLWDSVKWKVKTAACASPLIIDKERIFFCGGYSSGCMMMKLTKKGDKYEINPLWQQKEKFFGSIHHTPILKDGLIYGVNTRHALMCIDLDGNMLWTSKGKQNFGNMGPYIAIEDKMLIMDNSGLFFLISFNKDGFEVLSKHKILDHKDSWGMFSFVNGLIVARDFTNMVCLDVSAKGNAQ